MRDPVFEGIDPAELEGPLPERKWRRPLIIIVAILLGVMIFSLSFLDALIGIVQSETVSDGILVFSDTTVILTGGTLQALQDELLANQDREIKACLFGSKSGSTYTIDRVEFPEVIRANVVHVVSVPCASDVLIDLHSHPIHSCLASAQDVSVLEELQRRNPDVRMMVMCSRDRFALV